MNENEIQLKVQALVDGELTGTEAAALRVRIEGDEALRELHAGLTAARDLMDGAELSRTLPEPGDFYWSQISQAIEWEDRQAKRVGKPAAGPRTRLRGVAPRGGVGGLAIGVHGRADGYSPPAPWPPAAGGGGGDDGDGDDDDDGDGDDGDDGDDDGEKNA